MSRKKILWLCSWYPNKLEPFNGDFVQRHARAAALYNDIYVIHVAGYEGNKINETERSISSYPGLTEQLVLYKRSSSFLGRMRSHYRWLMITRQEIRRYLAENGKPDLVHVHIPIKAGIAGLWMKRKYNIPYVVTEHWGIYNEVEENNYSRKPETFKKYTRRVFEAAAKFISVSRYLAEGVNRLVTKKESVVIQNVVDTSLFYYKDHEPGQFRFIHVSNMVPLKNAAGILRAFKLYLQENNGSVLSMIGDPRSGLRDIAKELAIPPANLIFRGEIPYAEVAKEMQGSDCLILFSNIENSPCVIGEALCCGLPVIATNVGGIPELLDSYNSLLVEARDENGLATAMKKMMEDHQEYNRKQIAENATRKFSYQVIGKKLDEVYNAVVV
ncbi:MAG: glycosyltransferase [Chitinophagaceae bacterium]